MTMRITLRLVNPRWIDNILDIVTYYIDAATDRHYWYVDTIVIFRLSSSIQVNQISQMCYPKITAFFVLGLLAAESYPAQLFVSEKTLRYTYLSKTS